MVAAANAELDASRSQRGAEPAAVTQPAAPLRSSTFDRLVAGPSGAPHQTRQATLGLGKEALRYLRKGF
jgi:hypothetical protein